MLRKRVDKLGKDLVGHNSLGELIRVVGQTTKGQSSGLLDRWHVIEKKWTEKSHNACKSHETVSEKVQRRKSSNIKIDYLPADWRASMFWGR